MTHSDPLRFRVIWDSWWTIWMHCDSSGMHCESLWFIGNSLRFMAIHGVFGHNALYSYQRRMNKLWRGKLYCRVWNCSCKCIMVHCSLVRWENGKLFRCWNIFFRFSHKLDISFEILSRSLWPTSLLCWVIKPAHTFMNMRRRHHFKLRSKSSGHNLTRRRLQHANGCRWPRSTYLAQLPCKSFMGY